MPLNPLPQVTYKYLLPSSHCSPVLQSFHFCTRLPHSGQVLQPKAFQYPRQSKVIHELLLQTSSFLNHTTARLFSYSYGRGEPLVPRRPQWARGGEARGFLAEKRGTFRAATDRTTVEDLGGLREGWIGHIGRERDQMHCATSTDSVLFAARRHTAHITCLGRGSRGRGKPDKRHQVEDLHRNFRSTRMP